MTFVTEKLFQWLQYYNISTSNFSQESQLCSDGGLVFCSHSCLILHSSSSQSNGNTDNKVRFHGHNPYANSFETERG